MPALQPEPWDEGPKLAALSRAANVLLNAGLSGRPADGLEELLAPYETPGAEAVAVTNLRRSLEEGCRVAGRAVGVVVRPSGEVAVPGYYLAGSVHADGVSIPENHLVRPRVSATLALRVGRVIEHADVTVAEVMGAVEAVHAAVVVTCQRVGAPGEPTLLESVADNAHAGHVALSGRWLSPGDVDLERVRLDLDVDGTSGEHRPSPYAWLHLVGSLRRSVALFGPVRPGEVLVLPGVGTPAELLPGRTATLRSPAFGQVAVAHAAGAYDEGFEPITRAADPSR